jgi:hypothetical protein
MATHTRFPASRLPDRAELLVLIATAAGNETAAQGAPANAGLVRNKTYNAQIRNYTAMRRRAHINCDNSAKT